MNHRDACIGSLLGTATGDALGLPYEGLSARRGAKLFPDTTRHHLLPGKGMVSDDTEHACFTAQALLDSNEDIEVFRNRLGRSLRWWFAALPAGVGLATARAILKLWLGFSPRRSGVFSAGNGPSMRAPILGVVLGDKPEKLKSFVRASTEITHTDSKAYFAALATALAAHLSATANNLTHETYRSALQALVPMQEADELLDLIDQAAQSAAANEPLAKFADSIGSLNGISGYSYHTVPCVLQAWFRFPDDFARGLLEIVKTGGDTDTAGAIYGGIAGARVGKAGIPQAWRANIVEWPRSMAWIERLGDAVAQLNTEKSNPPVPRYFWPAIALRNLTFLFFVLAHGLRRLVPPY